MIKRVCIGFLVCVNVALLAGLGLASYSLPAAVAQGTGLSGNYMLVAGEIQDEYDALYVIDLRGRSLHAFIYDKSDNNLRYTDHRDLDKDFRANR